MGLPRQFQPWTVRRIFSEKVVLKEKKFYIQTRIVPIFGVRPIWEKIVLIIYTIEPFSGGSGISRLSGDQLHVKILSDLNPI